MAANIPGRGRWPGVCAHMSRWIGLFAGLALLAGCVAVDNGAALPRAAAFLGGEMKVMAPQGYCIDRAASHDAADGVVVLMGRCSEASTAAPALITLTAGGPGSAEVLGLGGKALSDYFTSSAGRAALARDGRAGSVKVSSAAVSGGVFVMRVSDRRAGEYWRAILGLKGRLVTISVTAPQGAALPADQGRKILDQAVKGFEAANRG